MDFYIQCQDELTWKRLESVLVEGLRVNLHKSLSFYRALSIAFAVVVHFYFCVTSLKNTQNTCATLLFLASIAPKFSHWIRTKRFYHHGANKTKTHAQHFYEGWLSFSIIVVVAVIKDWLPSSGELLCSFSTGLRQIHETGQVNCIFPRILA